MFPSFLRARNIEGRTLWNRNDSFYFIELQFDSIWWKHIYELASYREITSYTYVLSMFFFDRNSEASHATPG